MKVKTAEQYLTRYCKRGKKLEPRVRWSDRLEGMTAKIGATRFVKMDKPEPPYCYQFMRCPYQIGHGMKPEHHKRFFGA